MFKRLFVIITVLSCSVSAFAYNPKDSVKVETMLKSALALKGDVNLMEYFGMQFVGTPYVAHTLDMNKEESLVINTRQLDCTTFVENVVALTLCAEQKKCGFGDYCRMLQTIRYRNGRVGYTSRLHYFTEWMSDNKAKGIVDYVETSKAPFTSVQNVKVNYMTEHYTAYGMLKLHPEWLNEIGEMEKRLTGLSFRYIPKTSINNSQLLRETIHTGDIIAILTNKKGLDTSHIGIAVWKKDGLHLLNASQIHKKVVLEPMLFKDYMMKHPSQIGIRVCRVAELKKK